MRVRRERASMAREWRINALVPAFTLARPAGEREVYMAMSAASSAS
jgi:hypothetical protein